MLGVAATFLFPITSKYMGLIMACQIFITAEAILLFVGLIFYYLPLSTTLTIFPFLTFVILSRVGLYGWDVGQVEILQIGIPENMRGTVNSIDSSFTKLATLIAAFSGFVLPSAKDFYILIWGSTVSIALGAAIFWIWTFTSSGKKFSIEMYLMDQRQSEMIMIEHKTEVISQQ